MAKTQHSALFLPPAPSHPPHNGCDTYQLKRETAKLNLLRCVGIPTHMMPIINLRPLGTRGFKYYFDVNFELQSYW